jgi:hypothetical protein
MKWLSDSYFFGNNEQPVRDKFDEKIVGKCDSIQ